MRVCLAFAIFCLLAVSWTEGQDRKACRAVFSDQNRKQLAWLNGCVKKLGYKTGREKTQKSTCVWKCVLDDFKMLNADGNMDVKQYDHHLRTEWPEHIWERANVTFQPCLKITGVNTPDEFCKGYDPLVKCLNRNFANLCKGL